mmetsp:Transcript_27970/g.70195  ORF Transcript_27970/g.70195 Transcript_27970/m.70195 type:complete len:217 (+) Transcript_27970:731-1381(+)
MCTVALSAAIARLPRRARPPEPPEPPEPCSCSTLPCHSRGASLAKKRRSPTLLHGRWAGTKSSCRSSARALEFFSCVKSRTRVKLTVVCSYATTGEREVTSRSLAQKLVEGVSLLSSELLSSELLPPSPSLPGLASPSQPVWGLSVRPRRQRSKVVQKRCGVGMVAVTVSRARAQVAPLFPAGAAQAAPRATHSCSGMLRLEAGTPSRASTPLGVV